MKSFSERIGVTDVPTFLQIEGMDNELRISIWNWIHNAYQHSERDYWIPLSRAVAEGFRKFPLDHLPYYDHDCRKWLADYFNSLAWHKVYDLIEFIVRNCLNFAFVNQSQAISSINAVFQRERSGYRFVAGFLAPITDPIEVAEVSKAIESSARSGLEGARQHLVSAVSLFAKKPDPDYRNSVKEAISAVESIAKLLGKDSDGLAGALTALSNKSGMHGSLRSGFIKLYGYTSDEGGVRHAILDQNNVGADEARYMIVSCSAFVNYLISKSQSSGLI